MEGEPLPRSRESRRIYWEAVLIVLTSACEAQSMPSAGPPSADSVISRSHQRAKIPFGTLTAWPWKNSRNANLFKCLARHPGSVQNEYRTRGPVSLLQIVDSLRFRVHPSDPRRSHQSCSFASGQRAVLGISMGWPSAATSAILQSLRRRLLG